MLDVKNAREVVEQLSNKPFICGDDFMETSDYVIVKKPKPVENKVMNPQEFYKKMKELAEIEDFDEEDLHVDMDDLMCRVLTDLGYGDGIKIFNETPKWYA